MNTSFSSVGSIIIEIISKIVIEDPFLCSKCQKLGYCEAKYFKDAKTNTLIPIREHSSFNIINQKDDSINRLDKIDVIKLVNIRTEIYETNTKLGKKIQQAHDLFHQDEFEQASYLYQDILETRSDIREAWRGLLACFYFSGKYDDAVTVSMNNKTGLSTTFTNKLIKNCEQQLIKEKKIENSVPNNNSSYNLSLEITTQRVEHDLTTL